MIHTYSLADYQLVIGIPTIIAQNLNLKDEFGNLLNNISIGGPGENGEGSFVGKISAKRNKDLWTTEGDYTGSWVHNKNLDRTGEIELEINQISDKVIELIQLCKIYESVQTGTEGLTLTILGSSEDNGQPLFTGNDCLITKLPDFPLGSEADSLTWTFTCGQILYF